MGTEMTELSKTQVLTAKEVAMECQSEHTPLLSPRPSCPADQHENSSLQIRLHTLPHCCSQPIEMLGKFILHSASL